MRPAQRSQADQGGDLGPGEHLERGTGIRDGPGAGGKVSPSHG